MLDGDSTILFHFREWQGLWEAANQSGLTDAERDAACDRAQAPLDAIADTPAESAVGFAVKLVALFESNDYRLLIDRHRQTMEGRLWCSLIEDAVRFLPALAPIAAALPRKPVPLTTDAEMLAAERELAERRKAKSKPDDDAADPLFEIYDQIMMSEPRSLVGTAVKLRVLLDPDIGIASGLSPNDVPALRQILAVIEGQAAKEGRAPL
jgi:hypothetical protein